MLDSTVNLSSYSGWQHCLEEGFWTEERISKLASVLYISGDGFNTFYPLLFCRPSYKNYLTHSTPKAVIQPEYEMLIEEQQHFIKYEVLWFTLRNIRIISDNY